MKVSRNWIQKYLNFELPPIDDLVKKIGAQLGGVEDVEDLGAKYKGALIAKIVSCQPHPNSDHLHICLIDDGRVAQGVDRDANGNVQVVCGAPNVREGLLVVWLPPGTTVPESIGKDPFVLTARDLRGVVSNGMLASARELALGDNHEGILEVDVQAKPGDDFAKVYELDDYIIDIENKMFTHRPDLFGQLGVAREVAGILGHAFVSPEWYKIFPTNSGLAKSSQALPLEVHNELSHLVPRFMAVAISDVTIKQLPIILQTYLIRVGFRPINNVVDITNYMMMLTSQPLHAYDYDKVKALGGGDAATLMVRYPHPGEKLKLLNGKVLEPRSEAIMIATDKQLIGLGGVMGGADTEVDENTKNVILECATFDMYSIRKTSMSNGLFTDAVARFNKGQSPLQNPYVFDETLCMLGTHAGAKQASDVIDVSQVDGRQWVHQPVPVTAGFINSRLGLQLPPEDMKRLLEDVEFTVQVSGETLTVTAPYWRTDIEQREDVLEEIGRLYGFDHLPLELPSRRIEPAAKDKLLELRKNVRNTLSRAGANEVLTYSFVHGNLLDKVGQNRDQAFRLSNAISPDLQYYRLSLTPSLLANVHPNLKTGHNAFALFEMGLIHHKQSMDATDPNIPLEDAHIAFVLAASEKSVVSRLGGAAYYEAKAYAELLLPVLNARLVPLTAFDFGKDTWGQQMCMPYEPTRAAVIVKDALAWGVIGEFKSSVRKALKLPEYCAGFELGLELLYDLPKENYMSLPRFPKVEQDICLRVPSGTTYQTVYAFIATFLDENKPEHTIFRLSPLDIYASEGDATRKQITLRLSIASYERTLTDNEVSTLLDKVAKAAGESLDAERV